MEAYEELATLDLKRPLKSMEICFKFSGKISFYIV